MRNAAEGKERICPECGAAYPVTESKCPYCGYIHEAGAERNFFRRLEETRRTLDSVDDEARENYRREIRRDTGAIGKRILIAAAVLAALVGLFVFSERRLYQDDRDYTKEMVWQHEHFPELDRLYEEESYEELDSLLDQYIVEGHDVWEWDHFQEYIDKTGEQAGKQQG